MASVRRSTRQSTAAAQKSPRDAASLPQKVDIKETGKQTTRRKRVQNDDQENTVQGHEIQPAKKIKSKLSHQPTKSSFHATSLPPSAKQDSPLGQKTYWLLKAEPLPRYENGVNVAFSIDDLAACKVPEPWSGVRNPQARNNMQAMRKGDLGFFYHSNAKPSGVVGLLRVVEEAKVDETAFDSKDPYYDAKSDRKNPKWYCVGVEYVKKFDGVVDLKTIKGFAKGDGPLKDLQLVRNGRLSVCRMTSEEWRFILGLAENLSTEEAPPADE